ncbi:MAG: hypothetical protein JWM16_2514 [Verrucomicrobiales bacterium]|nr:hypothetical protein [Verrucomicrobiales bacterium]
MEFEQWVTLRTQRTKEGSVNQQNYNKWELREELEYGVTDRYTVGLYLNADAEKYREFVPGGRDVSDFNFAGISLENRYMVLNPADHAVGLTLYIEPRFSGDTAEIEQKILLGQRHGNWKWALNLSHATDWEDQLHEVEGEFEASFGIARQFGKNWSVGLEAKNTAAMPGYRQVEYDAVHVGPVVSYRQEKWWAALTVLPQVWGKNFDGNPDNNRHLDLAHNEKVNIRLLFGFSF